MVTIMQLGCRYLKLNDTKTIISLMSNGKVWSSFQENGEDDEEVKKVNLLDDDFSAKYDFQ